MASGNINEKPDAVDPRDREIARLRAVLSDMLHEFESDHEAVMDDEHEEDETANPELCTYCRIIAEAHAVLEADYGTPQAVAPAPAPMPIDLDCALMAPNGKRITRIVEEVLVDYELTYVRRTADGSIEFDYDDTQNSEVCWDSASPTQDENGEYTFEDEEGNSWKGSQLVKSIYHDDDYDSSKENWYGEDDDGEEEGEEE